MTPASQNSGARVDVNDLVNTFPWQQICKQQPTYCRVIAMETVFSVGSTRRLYNEDSRPTESQLSFEIPAYQDVSLGTEELN
jgi:hypothetical protein